MASKWASQVFSRVQRRGTAIEPENVGEADTGCGEGAIPVGGVLDDHQRNSDDAGGGGAS